MNLLALLQFAVEFLEIPDIIVMGHYGCGGVKAASTELDHGLLEHWLRNIRDLIFANVRAYLTSHIRSGTMRIHSD